MSNLHRIQWIDRQLRARRYPNARTIAERFEISTRQAARDIEYMRYSLGAPIEYCPGRKGYFYSDDAFSLPTRFLSSEDQQVLSYLAYQYANLGQGQAQRLAQLFQRLSAPTVVPERTKSIPALEITAREVYVFNQLKEALQRHLKVKLILTPCSGAPPESTLFAPYRLFVKNETSHVVGYCERLCQIRVIALCKVEQIQLTNMPFQIRAQFEDSHYTSQGFARFPVAYQAEVEFLAAVDWTRLPHQYQAVNHNRYLIEFYDSERLVLNLLCSCRAFQICSPQWLKHKLIDYLHRLLELNQ